MQTEIEDRSKKTIEEDDRNFIEKMRPAHNETSAVGATTGVHRWNSPIPYLFGGLAVMLGLITLALLILACSCCGGESSREGDESNRGRRDQKPAAAPATAMQLEMEPKFVVIMAGDHNPTCLAKPSARRREEV